MPCCAQTSVEKEQEPFYEAGWFAATTAVLGVVGGSIVCFVTGIWRLCRSCLQWMRVPGAGDTSVGVAAGNAGSHASGENDNTASTRDDNQPGPSS